MPSLLHLFHASAFAAYDEITTPAQEEISL